MRQAILLSILLISCGGSGKVKSVHEDSIVPLDSSSIEMVYPLSDGSAYLAGSTYIWYVREGKALKVMTKEGQPFQPADFYEIELTANGAAYITSDGTVWLLRKDKALTVEEVEKFEDLDSMPRVSINGLWPIYSSEKRKRLALEWEREALNQDGPDEYQEYDYRFR